MNLKLIEDYLSAVSSKIPNQKETIPPITKKLAGILKGKKEIDYRRDISEFLEKNYK